MPLASRGSSAYKLQPTVTPKKNAVTTRRPRKKPTAKKAGSVKLKLIVYVIAFFLIQGYLCSRWVSLYGLHSEITARTEYLNALCRENEQTAIAIDSMVETSRVEEYATNTLGMKKIEPSQIVYIKPVQSDSMQKVAKSGGGSSKRGIFGALSSTLGGALEYLR
ncbi:MAG: Cell division protein FtsL [Firmicutes bacterium ADurb.Bin193]|nr:MAG: Cell division protein FtsL [Firmicutes bacterium ADurb.Bin193]